MNLFKPFNRLLNQSLVILVIQRLVKNHLAEVPNNIPGLLPELVFGIRFSPLYIFPEAESHLLNLLAALVFDLFGVDLRLFDTLIDDFLTLPFRVGQFAVIFVQHLLGLFVSFFSIVNFLLNMILTLLQSLQQRFPCQFPQDKQQNRKP
jgi:hypothetical protein